jgi:hypothetical protein
MAPVWPILRCSLLLLIAFALGCTSDATNDLAWANGTGHACDPSTQGVNPPASVSDSLDTIPPLGQSGSPDATWAAIALHVPGGWAGAYRSDGRLVLMFVDANQISAGLDSLAVYGSYGGITIPANRDSLLLVPVRWNWIQLYQWYGYILRHPLTGLTFTDIQETNNRIELSASDASSRTRLLHQLADLHVPCWLVAVGIAVPIQLYP